MSSAGQVWLDYVELLNRHGLRPEWAGRIRGILKCFDRIDPGERMDSIREGSEDAESAETLAMLADLDGWFDGVDVPRCSYCCTPLPFGGITSFARGFHVITCRVCQNEGRGR